MAPVRDAKSLERLIGKLFNNNIIFFDSYCIYAQAATAKYTVHDFAISLVLHSSDATILEKIPYKAA
ncbi:hypothetical protein A4R89_05485 [Acetobacter ascendens]|nr:hypothetical protein A4R89_05485 [Acetobacter ascendens]